MSIFQVSELLNDKKYNVIDKLPTLKHFWNFEGSSDLANLWCIWDQCDLHGSGQQGMETMFITYTKKN